MEPRDSAAGDPVLHAIDHIDVAALVGARRHLRRGAAGAGLGDADGGLVAAQHHRRRELPLVLRTIGHDRADGAHVRLDDDTRRGAAHLRHLVDDEHGVEIAPPLPAILLRDRHAEEAGFDQILHVAPGILLGVVDLRRARREAPAREFAGFGLKRLLVCGQLKVHAESSAPFIVVPAQAGTHVAATA
jgi:hypothetical protein